MRLYWVQCHARKFEFLAGQSWSLLTPDRNGISPMPGDLFYSQDVDTNYQLGLTWTPHAAVPLHRARERYCLRRRLDRKSGAVHRQRRRAARRVRAPLKSTPVQAAAPSARRVRRRISTPTSSARSRSTRRPATRISTSTRPFVMSTDTRRSTRQRAPTSPRPAAAGRSTSILEPVKNFRLVAMNYFSNGGGRYIANTNMPDFIVNPDSSLSIVTSWSGHLRRRNPGQREDAALRLLQLAQADANTSSTRTARRRSATALPGRRPRTTKSRKTTVGLTQTFFRDAKIGGMQLMLQFSHLQRTPFSVPVGTPATREDEHVLRERPLHPAVDAQPRCKGADR